MNTIGTCAIGSIWGRSFRHRQSLTNVNGASKAQDVIETYQKRQYYHRRVRTTNSCHVVVRKPH